MSIGRIGTRAAVVGLGVLASLALMAAPSWARSAPPSLVWSPTTSGGTYDYGTLEAGEAKSETFKLTNSGGKASGALTVTLSASSAFSITSDECTERSLGPKKSCSVTVRYAPTTNGESDSATLTATGVHANASITLEGKARGSSGPVLSNIESTPLSYQAQTAPVAITSTLTISDTGTSSIASATVSITSGFSASADSLSFTTGNGITGSYNGATGVLTLSGVTTLAIYQAALRSVEFSTADSSASPAARTVSFAVTDSLGATSTGPAQRTINVSAHA